MCVILLTFQDHPIRNWAEHSREVFSLDWNNIQKELFASSSWDGTVKVVCFLFAYRQWNPDRPASVQTIQAHGGCVYRCAWSPHNPTILATASGDGTAHVFDLRAGAGPAGARPVSMMSVGGEVLSLDWNKYRPMTLATGSTDRAVKVWDMRKSAGGMAAAAPVTESTVLVGHQYAVRGLAWSTHQPSILASASYDMSVRIWNVDDAPPSHQVSVLNTPRMVYPMHKEFVVGVAWSLFEPGLLASTSWDTETHVWPAAA